jgi:hypothetical protein
MMRLKAQLRMRRRVFEDIYRHNMWGNKESRSGPGSTMACTESVRLELPALISRFGIRTMLDAACGDYYWMNRANLTLDLYLGADIVPELIESNRRRYGADSGRRKFIALDIVRDRIPKVDLIFCRHCMIHLSLRDATKGLENFVRSGSTYLLATTVPSCTINRDIRTGGFRGLNLELPPFSMPAPLERIHDAEFVDGKTVGEGWLYLWPLADLTPTD